jgi:hypothetical protein
MKQINVFARLLHNATDGSRFFARRIPDGKGGSRRVLINSEANAGRGKFITFPLDIFETAILSRLDEIDPRDIVNSGQGPDEVETLANELAWVESKINELENQLLGGEVAAVVRKLRELEGRKHDVVEKLTAARAKAAHPLSESWGECQSLVDTLDNAGDDEDVRVRLRAALRRIVESIYLIIVSRGYARLVAAQMWFTGGKHRDYLIVYRRPKANQWAKQKESWLVRSLTSADVDIADLDLRNRKDAAALEQVLIDADLQDMMNEV